MNRFKLMVAIVLMAMLALGGCSSKEDKKQSHLTKGKEYFDKGEFKSAKIELKNAIQIDAKFAPAHMLLAETSLKLGEAQEAFRAYSAVAELDPANTEAQLKLATFLLLAQKYDESRKRVDGVLAREPNNIEALLLLATLFDHDKNLFEAGNAFRKVIDINGKEARAYLGLARVLAQQGQTNEAERVLLQTLVIDPTSVKNRMAVFSFYVSQRKFDKAEEQIKRAVADTPRRCGPAHHAGQLLPGPQENRAGRGRLPQGGRGGPEECQALHGAGGFLRGPRPEGQVA